MRLTTNYHYYPLLCLSELPSRLQKQARDDYDWDEKLDDYNCLFVYRGYVYHIGNFTWNSERNPWQGYVIDDIWTFYANDTYFSGIMYRYAYDEFNELLEDNSGHALIQIATYYTG